MCVWASRSGNEQPGPLNRLRSRHPAGAAARHLDAKAPAAGGLRLSVAAACGCLFALVCQHGAYCQSQRLPSAADGRRLVEISFEQTGPNVLRGADARQQLLVVGRYEDGRLDDYTRRVRYDARPPGIVEIDAAGLVRPVAEGQVKITARGPGRLRDQLTLEVAQLVDPPPVNFVNQVVPIFTKHGCNAGACHGKSSGQNGFKLSLLGFYPDEDYEYLTKEARGRRVFPTAPERSLLLLKATGELPHGGGERLQVGGPEYQLLVRWMEQGLPYGSPEDAFVERLEVFPSQRTLARGGEQQLAVQAIYSDGTRHDVTALAQFESNDAEMAEVAPSGLVRALDVVGDVAVMARFQGHVAVFRATLPAEGVAGGTPRPRNFIDELVFARLQSLGIPASPPCDDATFLRRATLDIAGRLPTAEEVRAFEAETDDGKRDRLIERLLASPDYADYFASKWNAVLRNRRVNDNYARGAYAFHGWIRQALYQNMPYNEFVRGIVAATGEILEHPPVAWYRMVNTPELQVEDTAQLFLGLRIQCARCHHHPFERWSQHDYYSLAAFFSRVGVKPGSGGLGNDEPAVFHNRGEAGAVNPRTGETLPPAVLGGPPLAIEPDDDPRHVLVDWMESPDNPYFAAALVNRYWKHFFGRGIVDPEDDMRVTNPPSHPELLDALARHFVQSGYDLKELVRTICRSQTYQLASEPLPANQADRRNFSHYYPKRLQAEVLYDALHQLTGTVPEFPGLPSGTRAVQLPDSSTSNYFLQVFGRPEGTSACECERSTEANLAQSLHLLNSEEVQSRLGAEGGRVARLAADESLTDRQRVEELYAWAFARRPAAEELQLTLAHLQRAEDKRQALEDVVWALVNTKEFQFNH